MMNDIRTLLGELLDLFACLTCMACDRPFPVFPAESPCFCSPCAATLAPPTSVSMLDVCVAYAHAGAVARAIHRVKYERRPAWAARLAHLVDHAFDDVLHGIDVVVPVPLHHARLRERGFNQSVEIASRLGIDVCDNAVIRVRDTPRQVGLGRLGRVDNVRGAFRVARPAMLRGRTVLLFDDVVTTGATMVELALAVATARPRAIVCAALASAVLTHESMEPAGV